MKALLIDTAHSRVACLYADSAIGRDAMPLFLPEGRWRGRVHLALRVGRLGKAVSERFAQRYIDAYAPVLIIYNEEASTSNADCAIGCYMDSAVTAGRWEPIEQASPVKVHDGMPLTGGEGRLAGILPAADLEALARICVPLVSRHATIKTGDMLITDRHVDVDLRPDTCLQADALLRVKIK